jgi:CheY-like chemotaxis protein
MRKKILVVDDEPDYGTLLQRVMRDYDVRQETTVASALSVAYHWAPDIFVLDLHMPEMNGNELADMLRSDPQFTGTPILFISACVRVPECTEEPVRLHGLPAFGKPFNIDALRRQVAKQLRESELQGLLS